MMLLKKTELKPLFISILIPIFIGGLSALISMGAMSGYSGLEKPPLSPPAWLFPIVWSVLFVLMGVASFLVYNSEGSEEDVREALVLYGLQLLFNFLWSIIFFNLKLYTLAFVWLLALLVLVITTAVSFYKISKPAGLLLVPYILWIIFAGYLNLLIAILN